MGIDTWYDDGYAERETRVWAIRVKVTLPMYLRNISNSARQARRCENIIQAVKPKADQLPRDERMELARLIQVWEARNGKSKTATQIVQRVSEDVFPRNPASATYRITSRACHRGNVSIRLQELRYPRR